MKAQTMTIVGLERIGASLGMAVKNRLDMTVIGYDEDEAVAETAWQQMAAVDQIESSLVKAVRKADIIVVATHIAELENTFMVIGEEVQEHTLIIDLSPLKGVGLKWAKQHLKQGHYVGGMPVLAAKWLKDGRTDTTAASADLFQNSVFCLMPDPEADPEAVETAVNFGLVLGARPYFIDPLEYDNLLQATDTLPGLMAAALFKMVRSSTSWQDIFRFAGLPFGQATMQLAHNEDISMMALNDKEATLYWLEALVKELNELRQLIYEKEPAVVTAVLEDLSIERDRWLLKREENDWDDRGGADIETPSFIGQMLGSVLTDNNRRDKK